MGKITEISDQKRNKTRMNIFIDGEFACGAEKFAVAAARLKVGDEISSDELKKLIRASELDSAFDRAVGYLSLQPRARSEIISYLDGKGYEKDVITEVMSRLDGYGYTDDRAYAEIYIRSRSKKYGSFRISYELAQKGIDREIIQSLLGEDGEFDELGGATAAAKKYLASHKASDRQKLKRFLAGRGFSWECISQALSALENECLFCDDDQYDD